MLSRAIHYASDLDTWLQKHAGRPYRMALIMGLALSIIAIFKSLGDQVSAANLASHTVKTVGFALFQLALLVNQLAQWREFHEQRRARKQAGHK